MEVKFIDEQTIVFDEGHVRFFLLIGEEKALLVDSGMQTKNAKDLAEAYTKKPIELLNTHADMDHIASNSQFEWAYMHPNELMHYKGNIKPVWDMDVLDLGNRKVQIIHMPGHTPGSIGVLDIDRRILFSGDSIQEKGMIFMFGAMRNIPTNIHSLERLNSMNSFDTLYPSHAICPLNKSAIQKVIDLNKKVLEGSISFRDMEMHGHKIKAYTDEFATLLVD